MVNDVVSELEQILIDFNGAYSSQLYTDLIVLSKQSRFDVYEYMKFIWSYYLIGGKKCTSFQQLEESLNNDLKMFDYDRLSTRFKYTLSNLGSTGWSELCFFDRKTDKSNLESLKLYLSVGNASLHKFANLFISECLLRGYTDFHFKVNDDEDKNRRDNVVIYCNEKNLNLYFGLTKRIILQHPDIKLNASHLLGVDLGNGIFLGRDPKDNSNSYTGILSNEIFDQLSRGRSCKRIVDMVERVKAKTASEVNKLVLNSRR